MSANFVVVRYADGRLIKGHSLDLSPEKPRFHIIPAPPDGSGKPVEVLLKDLKAVFFVRDLTGNPSYMERKHYTAEERPLGRKVEVEFKDCEVLVGNTLGYQPHRQAFFLFPADPQTNNIRVLIVAGAVKNVRFL
jgi:hypothetical protein